MSSSNSVTVQILDKEYSIICPQEERNNLVSAARYLDGKMREIRSSGKVIGADPRQVIGWLAASAGLRERAERHLAGAGELRHRDGQDRDDDPEHHQRGDQVFG